MNLTIRDARVLTLAGENVPRRGPAARDLGIIERGYVQIQNDRIHAVGSGDPRLTDGEEIIEAAGRIVMPGFIDCHTHACWAGSRLDEFELLIAGTSYLDILKAGGGIMSTVRAVRAASETELADQLAERLRMMAAMGTITAEVKSGYGLNPEAELKMLRAIRAAADRAPITVVPTFLGAHAIDPDTSEFIEQTINETLPAVTREFPGIVCDAFCEIGAWSMQHTRRLFEAARTQGCPIRVHADQFNSLGMTRLAIEMGAISVDHLEAITPKDMEHLARSRTIAVCLPISGFHLDGRYAPGRELIDAGCAVAIASNYNPGSAPSPSMPFAIALACRKLRLTPAEAIVSATINAACVLGLQYETGSLEAGKRADLIMLNSRDERELGFDIAGPGPSLVIAGGRVIRNDAGMAAQRNH
jgi:imidazolonepropionase